MKLITKDISKEGGRVKLVPEDAEDLWTVYNLIAVGDRLRSETFRKVSSESSTGTVSSERLRLTLTIQVETLDFDASTPMLRLKGKNIVENEHVKMGAYHTLELETHRPFTLAKPGWDSVASDLITEACDVTKRADLGAVVMQEGLAYVCLITSSMTLTRARIEMSIPRKQGAAAMGRDKVLQKFYDAVMRAIIQHIDFGIVKCLLIASPGFVKEAFMNHINTMSHKMDLKCLTEHKSKFVMCHCSSGQKHALKEVLSDPAVASRLLDTKAAAETRALGRLFKMLNDDPERAAYGHAYVMRASHVGAIATLLISDNLFRCADPAARSAFVLLVEGVKGSGGEVHIFSTMHVSGERLEQLGGLAAILRFPMGEEEEALAAIEDDSDDDEDWDLLAELLAPSKKD
mmetsp:Transcript_69805/g.113320  ORF Transcript_69805/g.113320 Transcript_69805/m.113320 type:complete len:403 (+) Transcript_69805:119-1327(+)|eukprot:CAMPEP_0179432068 /NCGR_PEP_ID=MMETSP0799-20121207/16793_1 /TAXON_ID=46947 /ORGANISM="Geminigera cryophila, Strain CCMP2564" /LENGTH=402 /DNA_ID=CAMNT_0021209299 /DNA_START=101 /DNA_END=1309 /DNA_ORIENTATION=+